MCVFTKSYECVLEKITEPVFGEGAGQRRTQSATSCLISCFQEPMSALFAFHRSKENIHLPSRSQQYHQPSLSNSQLETAVFARYCFKPTFFRCGCNCSFQWKSVQYCFSFSLRLRVFDSGVMVVQLQSHNEEEMTASALDNVSVKPLS